MALATQSNRIKIGIRPTIDGRRMGVRESLETQTIRMAQSVAQLLQTHIRHTDGTFVECVVADSTIGGVAEAAACADKFKRENVGLTITVTPCCVMAQKPLIWILTCLKQFGDLTVRNAQVRFTWLPPLLVILN